MAIFFYCKSDNAFKNAFGTRIIPIAKITNVTLGCLFSVGQIIIMNFNDDWNKDRLQVWFIVYALIQILTLWTAVGHKIYNSLCVAKSDDKIDLPAEENKPKQEEKASEQEKLTSH